MLYSLILLHSLFSRQVRVGYFLYEGYQNLVNGEYSGFGYEYLKEIQKYNTWQYEFITEVPSLDGKGNPTGSYIPLSYARALDMLEEGSLDIVGSVRKTPEREQRYLFSNFGCGIAYEMLTACESKQEIETGKKIVIGLRSGCVREEEFTEIYTKAGFSDISLRYFDYDNEMLKALKETKEIDYILSSSLRKTEGEQLVYKYNPKEHYFIFNKDRSDIADEFNLAQEQILLQKTAFAETLTAKYYKGTKNSTVWISNTEKKYVEEHPVVQVIHDSSWFPVDYADGEGNPKGIVFDIFCILEKDTGIRFNFVPAENYESAITLFKEKKDTILAIFANDYTWAEKNSVKISSSYINLPMSVVSRERVENIYEPSLKVSGVKGYFFNQKYLKGYDTVLLVENVEACLEMVRTKKADITFVSSYSAERLLQKPKYENMYFYTLADMNYDVGIAFHTDTDPELYQILNKAVNNLSEVEVDQCIYDNTLYYMEPENFFYFAEKYGEGLIAGFIILCAVVIFIIYLFLMNTRSKKMNEKLALSNSELQKAFSYAEQANRAKTEFLSRVSHDIRTPMNIITGMTDIALENIQNQDLVKKSLRKILNASDFLLKLINDVLDMSRIENGKMIISHDYFYISGIVNHLIDFFEHRMREKNLSFTIDTSSVIHDYVLGDAVHIEQVLMNLVSNAYKYTEKGSVNITITEEDRDDSYALFTFTVKDSGIGIQKEFISKIWEPFEKERDSKSSSSTSFGLGLAIVKSLVNLMGGTTGVQSTEGEGSSFTVKLPLGRFMGDEPLKASDTIEEQKNYEFHNELILVVEDNELNMEIAQILLHTKNLRSEAVYNGEEAVKKFSQSKSGTYSAILMDIRMPGIDGREATRRIRSLNRKDAFTIPIIAMSADAFAEEIKISQSAGMNEYITKPVKKQELYRVLDKWINFREK